MMKPLPLSLGVSALSLCSRVAIAFMSAGVGGALLETLNGNQHFHRLSGSPGSSAVVLEA